jgi:hypothetical protein
VKNFQPLIRQQARLFLAIGLTVLILLPSSVLTTSAHAPTPVSGSTDRDYFMVYAGPDGDAVCRAADAAERSELEKITPRNLRQINHVADKSVELNENTVSHLTIILRATTNLDNNAPAKAAFIRAAANWENLINSPVTIFIDADFGPDNFGQAWPSGVLGSTSSPSATFTYSVVRGNLISGANTPEKSTVYNALPANSVPVAVDAGNASASSISVSATIGRAIGLLNATADASDQAAHIGFNSNFSYDFDRSDGVTGTDFESVATHEIGHALGFTSRAGSGSSTPAMWDLYRFRTGMTSAAFTNTPRVMTIGGTPDPLQFYFVPGSSQLGLSNGGPNGAKDNGADGNQSSHWLQAVLNGGVISGYIGIMDPRIPGNLTRSITDNDVNALNIFGFNSNAVAPPAPPANDNFAAAQTVTGCSGTVNGTNVGATKEAGEPNHLSTTTDPTGGGSRSVWYKWQAPSTTSVTFATEGSSFDTVMGVYTGSSVSSLTVVGQHDDVSSTDKTSSVTFNATAGTTYMIAVDGYNNGGAGGDFGSITLSWTTTNCTVAANQIDDPTFFVHQHYTDFLNREPDAAGLNFWVSEITSCGANASCIDVKRVNVSAAFFLSIEFQETGYLAYRIYKAAFGNRPGAPVPIVFSDFIRDSQTIGQNVQVGVGNWQTQLESNKQAFTLAFVQRADFLAAFPNNMTATQFVTKLNTQAGGVLSASEQTNLVNLLGATPADLTKRSQVLRAVAEDSDLKTAEFNRAFVLMQYFGYLRRNPNDAPDGNFDGYNFWLTKLNQFNGDFVAAEMVRAFISSTEYRHRFGP